MSRYKYTNEHDWIRLDGKDIATIGITDYAQDQLGDIVYVELPEVGRELNKGEEVAVIESVKAASDINIPVSGTIVEINQKLNDSPKLVNQDPLESGWLFKVKLRDIKELDELMDEELYITYIKKTGLIHF